MRQRAANLAARGYRVFAERRADMAQYAGAQIGDAVMRVDQFAPALLVINFLGDGVDGEIAAQQILLQRDIRRGVDGETLVAARGLALGARQRVFLMGLRMQEHREILAHRLKALPDHVFRRAAHPVS